MNRQILPRLGGAQACAFLLQTDEYIKLADVEDRMWYFRSLHRHGVNALHTEPAEPLPPGPILDAGCGTGGFIKRLAPQFPDRRVDGIDFSALACDLARRRTGANIEVASITSLPFADESYAAVLSLDVIVQIPNPQDALREFYRVLTPGGRLVINAAAYRWLWSYHDDSCQTCHRYNKRELVDLIRSAGFRIEQATYWNFIPLPLIVAKRKLFRTASDTSDVRLYPAPVEALLDAAMALEHTWIRTVSPLPAGSSVFVVARKPI